MNPFFELTPAERVRVELRDALGPGRFPLPGGHVHDFNRAIIDRPFADRGRGWMLDNMEMIAGYRCACGVRRWRRGPEPDPDPEIQLSIDIKQTLRIMRERYVKGADAGLRPWDSFLDRRPL